MGIFSNLRMGARLLPYIAVAGLFATMFLTNQKNIDAMKDVTGRLDKMIVETRGLQDQLEQMKRGQVALTEVLDVSNDRADEAARQNQQQTKLLREIASAKPEDDGDVAPVLDRTLTSIDGLRGEAKAANGGDGSKAGPAS